MRPHEEISASISFEQYLKLNSHCCKIKILGWVVIIHVKIHLKLHPSHLNSIVRATVRQELLSKTHPASSKQTKTHLLKSVMMTSHFHKLNFNIFT